MRYITLLDTPKYAHYTKVKFINLDIPDERQVVDNLYTVSEVAAKLNLSDKTLRRWEEAGRFRAERSLGNQRRYSVEDIQILDAIKHGTIPDQSDLLTLTQAAKHCGVAEVTLERWEREGKIHPFITVGKTYYPRHQLMHKLDELKADFPSPPDLPPVKPPLADPPVALRWTKAPPVSLTQPDPGTFNLRAALFNILLTLILLTGYHLIFNQGASSPLSPTPGSVQGATATSDPTLTLLKSILDPSGALTTTTLSARAGVTAPTLTFTPTSAPSAPTPGTIYYDATSDAVKIYRKNAWSDLAPTQTITAKDGSFVFGTAVLGKNKNQVTVSSPQVRPHSLVTVTFLGDYAPAKKYWLETAEGSFTLRTDFPVALDSPFNYFILSTLLTEPLPATPSAQP